MYISVYTALNWHATITGLSIRNVLVWLTTLWEMLALFMYVIPKYWLTKKNCILEKSGTNFNGSGDKRSFH